MVTVVSDLDLAIAPRLARTIEQLQTSSVDDLVIDLTNVSFVDSAGMRVLVRATKACEAAGIRFGVRGTRNPVRRRFALTGLDRVLPLD